MVSRLLITEKNRYIWRLMKVLKNKRPYYAQWWFFISLLILGWATPVTKHWELFYFGKTTTGYPIKIFYNTLIPKWRYVFPVNGKQYYCHFKDEPHQMNQKREDIIVYYDKENPKKNVSFEINNLYQDNHLFFPVAFQIGLLAFFISVRVK